MDNDIDRFAVDVAMNGEGSTLATIGNSIIRFNCIDDFDEFVDVLKTRRDACVFKSTPLDDQMSSEIVAEAISVIEKETNDRCLGDKEIVMDSENGPVNQKGGVQASRDLSSETEGEQISDIMDTALNYFTDANYTVRREDSTIHLSINGKNGIWISFAKVFEEQQRLALYSICPVTVPEEKMPGISEYLSRANYGLLIGNFELDNTNGVIRYKTSIDVEGDRLVPNLIKQLVNANFSCMDMYLPGIMKVIYGNESPSEVIDKIEK